MLTEAVLSEGLTKEDFLTKEEELGPLRERLTQNTQEGIRTIDESDSHGEGKEVDLISHLNSVETKWEQLLNLEVDIKKISSSSRNLEPTRR